MPLDILKSRIPVRVRIFTGLLVFAAVGYALASLASVEYERATAVTPNSLVGCFATSTDPTFASSCLHKTVGTLLSQMSPRQLQTYTVSSTSPITIRNECHSIGHIIGEETFKRLPSLEAALSLCSNDCRSACVHGAVGAGVLKEIGSEYPDEDIAHADNATLEKIGSGYCKVSFALCHAIGHLALILNNEQLPALRICDDVATSFAREACYQGVYMERAGGSRALFPFARSTTYKVSDGNYTYPCLEISGQYRHACFQFIPEFQESLFAKQGITSTSTMLQIATQACKSLSQKDRSSCIEGIGLHSNVYGYNLYSNQNIQDLCDQYSDHTDRDSCTLGVVPKFLFLHERGIKYCADIKEAGRRTLCYRATFRWEEGYPNESDPKTRICGTYTLCASQYDEFQRASSTIPDYRFGLFGK